MGAQGVGYQSVVVDSLVNPPLLEEGGQVFCFDSLHMHIGNIPDTDAPQGSAHSRSATSVAGGTDYEN